MGALVRCRPVVSVVLLMAILISAFSPVFEKPREVEGQVVALGAACVASSFCVAVVGAATIAAVYYGMDSDGSTLQAFIDDFEGYILGGGSGVDDMRDAFELHPSYFKLSELDIAMILLLAGINNPPLSIIPDVPCGSGCTGSPAGLFNMSTTTSAAVSGMIVGPPGVLVNGVLYELCGTGAFRIFAAGHGTFQVRITDMSQTHVYVDDVVDSLSQSTRSWLWRGTMTESESPGNFCGSTPFLATVQLLSTNGAVGIGFSSVTVTGNAAGSAAVRGTGYEGFFATGVTGVVLPEASKLYPPADLNDLVDLTADEVITGSGERTDGTVGPWVDTGGEVAPGTGSDTDSWLEKIFGVSTGIFNGVKDLPRLLQNVYEAIVALPETIGALFDPAVAVAAWSTTYYPQLQTASAGAAPICFGDDLASVGDLYSGSSGAITIPFVLDKEASWTPTAEVTGVSQAASGIAVMVVTVMWLLGRIRSIIGGGRASDD